MNNGFKSETLTVPSWGGRDAGKTFVIDEMPAMRAEKWAWRLAIVLKGNQTQIPESAALIREIGIVGITARALNSFLLADVDYPKFEELLDEMLGCVTIVRDPRYADVKTKLAETDIMEVKTIEWLRSEVLRVHTGFSVADGLFRLISAAGASAGAPS